MVREVEVTVRHTRPSNLHQRTVHVTRPYKTPATPTVVDVEVSDVLKRAATSFLIPLRPKPPPPRSYNLEFYVNIMRFTAKLSYQAPKQKDGAPTNRAEREERASKQRRQLELPGVELENQSLLSNLGETLPLTPREDTTEFDLESVCSELDLESLPSRAPSRAPSPGDLPSPGLKRKVPLINLSSAPAEHVPPSGR